MDNRNKGIFHGTKGNRLVAIAIAGTLSLAGLASPVTALAADPTYPFPESHYANGSLTIKQKNPNQDTKYDGYRIFKAVVTTGSDGKDKAVDVQWESDGVKTVVLQFINTKGYVAWLSANGHTTPVNNVQPHDLAQNAADFISEKIGYEGEAGASATAPNTSTTPRTTEGSSFANEFARAIVSSSLAPTAQGQAQNAAYTGKQGYYLFVTQNTSSNPNIIGDLEAGTAPIWVAISQQEKSIDEKASMPTIEKKVKEDGGTDAWGDSADANKGQLLDYRLTATLPNNVTAFEKYHMLFTDRMTNITMSTDSVKILIDSTDVTNKVKAQAGYRIVFEPTGTANEQRLIVEIPDIRSLDATITATSKVYVEYKAALTETSVMGSQGNPNTVKLTYSSDPNVTWPATTPQTPDVPESHDDTNEDTVRVFTYGIELHKVDQETRENLQNAKFTIQVASGNTDEASIGKYVQADGSLGATAYEWTTGTDGKFSVPRIDEGRYTIHETTPPADHDAWAADATLVITSTRSSSGTLDGLVAAITGANDMWYGNPQSHQDGLFDLNNAVSSGKVGIRVSDKRKTYLPGTGLTTSQAGVIFGAICVTAGLVGIIRYRKRESEDDES